MSSNEMEAADTEFAVRAKALLGASADELSGRVRSRLTRARYAALEAARPTPARHWRKMPASASRSRTLTSSNGTSPSCLTAPIYRRAAARRRRAPGFSPRNARPATAIMPKAASRPSTRRWLAANRSPTASIRSRPSPTTMPMRPPSSITHAAPCPTTCRAR